MSEVHAIKEHLRELANDVLEHRVERGDAIAVNQLYQTVLKAITTELRNMSSSSWWGAWKR
jgi:microsomal dipeptidase-like Zn-dependent dipeptidase